MVVAWFIRVAQRQLQNYRGGTRNVAVAIDEEGYSVTGQEGTVRTFPWTTFNAIEQRRGFIVFQAPGGKAIALPEAALDALQKRELLDFARRRGLSRRSG